MRLLVDAQLPPDVTLGFGHRPVSTPVMPARGQTPAGIHDLLAGRDAGAVDKK